MYQQVSSNNVSTFKVLGNISYDKVFNRTQLRVLALKSNKICQQCQLCQWGIGLVVLHCVFILSAISPYATGLKALFNPCSCIQLHWYSQNSPVTDIPLTERQRLKDDHLSTSLRFFSLTLGIGPNNRGQQF